MALENNHEESTILVLDFLLKENKNELLLLEKKSLLQKAFIAKKYKICKFLMDTWRCDLTFEMSEKEEQEWNLFLKNVK